VRVDLVVATKGRAEELDRLLRSLAAQTHRDFRLIVVDQNDDGSLEPLLAAHEHDLTIVHARSSPGLSRARNVGLRLVDADVVAFPDDDCWYPADLLEHVVAELEAHPRRDGVCGRSTDDDGRPSNIRWDADAGPIDRFNVWRRASSITIFLRRRVIERVGEFDEELGVGSGTRWQSGEETDYLLRALAAGFTLDYEPTVEVHHDSPRPTFANSSGAAYAAGVGNGRVLRTHGYTWWFVAYRVSYLVAASMMFLVTGRPALARFYSSMAVGRARGWLAR